MENKQGLYMVAIVSIVAIVGIMIMTISSNSSLSDESFYSEKFYSAESGSKSLGSISSNNDNVGLPIIVASCTDNDGNAIGSSYNGITNLEQSSFYIASTTKVSSTTYTDAGYGSNITEYYCDSKGKIGYYVYSCPYGAKGVASTSYATVEGRCAGALGATGYTCSAVTHLGVSIPSNGIITSKSKYDQETITIKDSSGNVINTIRESCWSSKTASAPAKTVQLNCNPDGTVKMTILDCETGCSIGACISNATEPVTKASCEYHIDNDGDGRGRNSITNFCGTPPSNYYTTPNADCNDNDPTVYTGAPERCDRFDNDCNSATAIDAGCDDDGDGFADSGMICTQTWTTSTGTQLSCGNYGGDCNDQNSGIKPGATEICGNGIDEDCNGSDLACAISCTDSDGSDDHNIKGITTITSGSTIVEQKNDSCLNASNNNAVVLSCFGINCTTTEYVCVSGYDYVINYGRAAGYGGCKNGVYMEYNCSDSDGGLTTSSKGTVTEYDLYGGYAGVGYKSNNFTGNYTDSCYNTTTVREYVCDSKKRAINYLVACPSGQTCSNGACLAVSNACTDSDGGINYTSAGSISITTSSGTGTKSDWCTNTPNQLQEEYCNGTIEGVSFYTCPNGCSNGACLPAPTCTGSTNQSCTITNINGVCSGSQSRTCSNGVWSSWSTCNATTPAAETCNGLDDNCNNDIDESVKTIYYLDRDGDGYGNSSSGATLACTKPSGYSTTNNDCLDDSVTVSTGSATIYPGAPELCDGRDNDCDGIVDEGASLTWYRDSDGDGFGNSLYTTSSCSKPTGYVANSTDCNDNIASVWKYLTGYIDQDMDTYTLSGAYNVCSGNSLPSGYRSSPSSIIDCNDVDSTVNPGATEICDNVNNDCDASIDEGCDSDGDFYADSNITCSGSFRDYGGNVRLCSSYSNDCNDEISSINPGRTEICNGIDDNCNGNIDEGVATTYYRDADGDGYGTSSNYITACSQPAGYVTSYTDCNDANSAIKPGATDICGNSIDEDCTGSDKTCSCSTGTFNCQYVNCGTYGVDYKNAGCVLSGSSCTGTGQCRALGQYLCSQTSGCSWI